MANIHDVYQDISRMTAVAEKVAEDNYASPADLAEQAERLEEIAEIAARNAAILASLDEVLAA